MLMEVRQSRSLTIVLRAPEAPPADLVLVQQGDAVTVSQDDTVAAPADAMEIDQE